MDEMANPRFEAALDFAVAVHKARGRARRGRDFPSVGHSIRVAEILDWFHCDDDVVVAGFLHETINGGDVTRARLSDEFNDRVAALVCELSELDVPSRWNTRAQETFSALASMDDEALHHLVAANELDEVRALAESIRHLRREATWRLFAASERQLERYFTAMATALLEKDADNLLFRALDLEARELLPGTGRQTSFLPGRPFRRPHDARAYLADPIKHWKPDHSAQELAEAWIGAGGIPPTVERVLETCEAYATHRLVEGFFEREVELPTAGRPSQTDLLALVELADGYGVIAVEGKARESFGPVISTWNDGAGKQARLDDLCARLGLDPTGVADLRYQLLHRTVSALLEAERYGATEALMLVHSFDTRDASLADYQAFAAALGLSGAEPNTITSHTVRDGVTLRLGWVKER